MAPAVLCLVAQIALVTIGVVVPALMLHRRALTTLPLT
jgi:hypothetical protein